VEVSGPGRVLIEQLIKENERKGFLDTPALERISRSLALPSSRVFSIAGQLEHFDFFSRPGRTVNVCCGPACALAGSDRLYDSASEELGGGDRGTRIHFSMGSPYWHRPIMVEVDDRRKRRLAEKIKPADLGSLKALVKGASSNGLRPLATGIETRAESLSAKGERVATHRRGRPRGDLALSKPELDPVTILGIIKDSGILDTASGCELAGLITEVAEGKDGRRLVVCDVGGSEPENSPGPTIASLDPVGVLEGLTIAAFASGADEAVLVVPYEDPELRDLFSKLLSGLRKQRVASIKLELFAIPNFIPCDREIGIASLFGGLTFSEGVTRAKRSRRHLWGRDVLVSVPEVFAALPWLLANGARAYRGLRGAGTRVVTIGGKVKRPCLAEVSLGSSLDELISEYAGGLPQRSEIKAIHFGGVFGGPLRSGAKRSSLRSLYNKYGSTGVSQLLAIDQSTCLVQWSEHFARLAERLCCGACVPGRLGPPYVLRILSRIRAGDGRPSDLDEIEATVDLMKEASLCPQGGKVLNPVILSLQNFKKEFEEHVIERKCAAGVCWPRS
jgi:NADH:ubiquinone oxidoreductase subunit F (NADH-binding)